MDYGRDPTEATKRLDGMLLAGDAVISIDNIEAAIERRGALPDVDAGKQAYPSAGGSVMVTVPCTALLTAIT
jgi:hypothetical protein